MAGERQAAVYLREAQAHEAAGRVAAAADAYGTAAELAAQEDQPRVLSEALRRRGVLCHLQEQRERARSLCCRAYDIAMVARQYDLAAEALNTLAGFELERGRLNEAQDQYRAALELASAVPALAGTIQQNLGVVANLGGDWETACHHYQQALVAYERTQDFRGCAVAYHNLGRIHAERQEWEGARAMATEAVEIFSRIDASHDRAEAERLLEEAVRALMAGASS